MGTGSLSAGSCFTGAISSRKAEPPDVRDSWRQWGWALCPGLALNAAQGPHWYQSDPLTTVSSLYPSASGFTVAGFPESEWSFLRTGSADQQFILFVSFLYWVHASKENPMSNCELQPPPTTQNLTKIRQLLSAATWPSGLLRSFLLFPVPCYPLPQSLDPCELRISSGSYVWSLPYPLKAECPAEPWGCCPIRKVSLACPFWELSVFGSVLRRLIVAAQHEVAFWGDVAARLQSLLKEI